MDSSQGSEEGKTNSRRSLGMLSSQETTEERQWEHSEKTRSLLFQEPGTGQQKGLTVKLAPLIIISF